MTVRVRFAPSPTGHLHIGSARTALFNYLFAKKHQGTYILRIEDTDQARNKENAVEKFIEGFKWLGLHWDEGPDVGGPHAPYTCMERLDTYRPYVQQLLDEEKAYPCFCSKEQLDAEREEAQAEGRVYRYSGRCSTLSPEERAERIAAGEEYTIRFRLPENEAVRFQDMIRGDMEFHTKDMGDFIIVKSDGVPIYNFAVTVDDALMEITHVIRGEEHLSNTPPQILLYQALGWDVPTFAHLPLILNPNGKKLSKRDESLLQFIEQYKDLGYLPEALNNFLVLLGWAPEGEQEIFTMDELIEQFTFDRVSKSGAIFDQDKLTWMNGQYIKALPLERAVEFATPYLKEAYGDLSDDYIRDLVSLFQTATNTFSEIVPLARLFFAEPVRDVEGQEVLMEEQVPTVLTAFRDKVSGMEAYTPEQIKEGLKAVQKETGYKGKQLFMPIRVATTGQTHGPDLNLTLYLLGKEKVLDRLTQLVAVK